MDIQFIDITSYRGICSDAEHWYAKIITDFKPVNESLAIEGTNVYGWDEEVKFYPTKEQAMKLLKKEEYIKNIKDTSESFYQYRLEDLMKNGTIRFSTILDIVKVCRNNFPKSILVFSIKGSQKEFKKWLIGMYESKYDEQKEIANEIIKLIEDIDYESS